MQDFLKDYEQIVILIIGATFTALGFIFQSILNIFLEKSKSKNLHREFLWKEKIQAAKKASEYYLLHMNFLNLGAQHYELLEHSTENSEEIIKEMQGIIYEYRKRLLDFPHFEHHHINIFIELEDSKADEIAQNNYKCFENIASIHFDEGDTLDEINLKMLSLKKNFKKLKENHKLVIETYKKYLKAIREQINTVP